MVRYLVRRTHDPALAEELAQETFARATRAFLGFRGEQPLGWLLSIARNVHLDHLRRNRRVVAWDDALLDDAYVDHVDHLDHAEPFDAEVEAVLAQLSPGARRLLSLVYLDGFTPAEVAAMTGSAPGTVRMALLRARDAFRVIWEHADHEEQT